MKVSKVNLLLFWLSCLMCFWLSTGLSSNEDPAAIALSGALAEYNNTSCKKALVLFIEAREINSSLLDAWYGEGKCYYELGKEDPEKYIECNELCDKILIGKPSDKGLSRFHALSGDCKKAYKDATGKTMPVTKPGTEGGNVSVPEAYQQILGSYDKAIGLDPNNSEAWNSKGVVLAELNNPSGSIYCFNEALKINSSLAEVWNNKGASLASLRRYGEALECLDNATKLNPNLAEAWWNKVKTFGKLKDEARDKAIALNRPDLGQRLEFNWLWANSS